MTPFRVGISYFLKWIVSRLINNCTLLTQPFHRFTDLSISANPVAVSRFLFLNFPQFNQEEGKFKKKKCLSSFRILSTACIHLGTQTPSSSSSSRQRELLYLLTNQKQLWVTIGVPAINTVADGNSEPLIQWKGREMFPSCDWHSDRPISKRSSLECISKRALQMLYHHI